jgi:DNA-binding MarR family transcriptional regulator
VAPRTPAGDALTDLVLPAFALNGELLAAAEEMTRPVGLTPAWWQVLGATLTEPLPVAEIARRVGLTRQSVQRVADTLVARGWATYAENPAHRRAKLFAPTPASRESIASLAESQHAWADAVGGEVGEDDLRQALATIHRIVAASRAYRDGAAERFSPPAERNGARDESPFRAS